MKAGRGDKLKRPSKHRAGTILGTGPSLVPEARDFVDYAELRRCLFIRRMGIWAHRRPHLGCPFIDVEGVSVYNPELAFLRDKREAAQ